VHPTALALKSLTPTVTQNIRRYLTTVGTAKAFWPAGAFQYRFALRLGTQLLKKRGQRQARLKLDAIHGHNRTPT
jgi:hypothetical protein